MRPHEVAELVERALERGHGVTIRLEDLEGAQRVDAGSALPPRRFAAPAPPAMPPNVLVRGRFNGEERLKLPAEHRGGRMVAACAWLALAFVLAGIGAAVEGLALAAVLAWAGAALVYLGGLRLVDRAGSRRTRDRQGAR